MIAESCPMPPLNPNVDCARIRNPDASTMEVTTNAAPTVENAYRTAPSASRCAGARTLSTHAAEVYDAAPAGKGLRAARALDGDGAPSARLGAQVEHVQRAGVPGELRLRRSGGGRAVERRRV